jgi:uncharacterized protein YjbJ (UPF0337 family)
MPSSDSIKGKSKRVMGKTKEKVGKVVGSERMESEGKTEHMKGVVQENYGKAKDSIKKKIK